MHKTFDSILRQHRADDKADMGEKYPVNRSLARFDRWHGCSIFDSDDPVTLANWALNWNTVLDASIIPVLDDEEKRKPGKSRK